MTEMDWNYKWATYEGKVRVILDDTSVAFGTATGDHHTEADNPLMKVRLDGANIWVHPRHVRPTGEYE
jgi:hypothetical protein